MALTTGSSSFVKQILTPNSLTFAHDRVYILKRKHNYLLCIDLVHRRKPQVLSFSQPRSQSLTPRPQIFIQDYGNFCQKLPQSPKRNMTFVAEKDYS